MKISGQNVSIRETLEITLPRKNGEGVKLKVSGVPIGFNAEYDRVWGGRPIPPKKTINMTGGKVNVEAQFDDPNFLEQLKEYEFHKTIYLVYRGLKADSTVTFDCLAGGEATNKEHVKSIAKEMSAAGMSEGDISILIEGVHAASHIDEKEVKTAIASF